MKLANRVRAIVESALLKIERQSPEWQELHGGAPGLWVWRIEPVRAGQLDLLVTVQHGAIVGGIERNVTAHRFPQKVLIDVTFWQRTRLTIAGLSPVAQAAAGTATALGAIGTALWATWGFWSERRKRKRREKKKPRGARNAR